MENDQTGNERRRTGPAAVDAHGGGAGALPGGERVLVREIDWERENPRDWDFEEDFDQLERECAEDRAATGCVGHEVHQYAAEHWLVWRVWAWPEEEMPTGEPHSEDADHDEGGGA